MIKSYVFVISLLEKKYDPIHTVTKDKLKKKEIDTFQFQILEYSIITSKKKKIQGFISLQKRSYSSVAFIQSLTFIQNDWLPWFPLPCLRPCMVNFCMN